MSAVLGGTHSLHTNGFDEALGLPTTDSAKLALRSQQILAYESGITSVPDPLAGSYHLEELTDNLVEKAKNYIYRIADIGGSSSAINFMRQEIEKAAYAHQKNIEEGKQVVVGVNKFVDEGEEVAPQSGSDYLELENNQRKSLGKIKAKRDEGRVVEACRQIKRTLKSEENLMPILIKAVKAEVTLGEISNLLREEWGEYQA